MLNENIRKFRLGVWAPSSSVPETSDGRSLSRIFGPFNAMRREDARLEIVLPPVPAGSKFAQADWDWFGGLDALYLLDPCSAGDYDVLRLAVATGCRVWVDYIDDLLNVPASNPHFLSFASRDNIRDVVGACIERATVTTTTTFTLKSRLPHREKVLILPESCRWPACPFPRQRVVSWRGGGSHRDDLESVLPQMADIARMPQFSQWQWAFLGEPSYKIYEAIPKDRLLTVLWQSPYEFMNTWGGLAPYLHVAPLLDNAFNRAKTPLAWLEATAVGAAVIGPALPEWNTCKGLIQYRTPEEFGEILKRELFTFEEGGRLHPAAIQSREDVYPVKTLAQVNELRWEILGEMQNAECRMQKQETEVAK